MVYLFNGAFLVCPNLLIFPVFPSLVAAVCKEGACRMLPPAVVPASSLTVSVLVTGGCRPAFNLSKLFGRCTSDEAILVFKKVLSFAGDFLNAMQMFSLSKMIGKQFLSLVSLAAHLVGFKLSLSEFKSKFKFCDGWLFGSSTGNI